jgi:antagonist of KipI
MGLRIVKTGISMSLQDAGRRGYRSQGVPLSGAVDMDAYRMANLLCGNRPGVPAVEITMHGGVMVAERALCLAHVGGGSRLHVNGSPVPMGRLVRVDAGSLLSFLPYCCGCRSYLSVVGGFQARMDLGSGSTYASAGLGGLSGRWLRSGDLLDSMDANASVSARLREGVSDGIHGWSAARWGLVTQVLSEVGPFRLRVLPGPEWGLFPASVRDRFLGGVYRVTKDANRMGLRLSGPSLAGGMTGELVSSAVCPGTVQMTHGGLPMLLLADAQTVGGYPRMANVFSADLPVCGQLRPGDEVVFVLGGLAEAEAAHRERERRFRQWERALGLRFEG